MEIGNVTVSSYTIALLFTWLIIGLWWNSRAFYMLISLLSYTAIQAITTTDFQAFSICGALYFYFASSNIKFSKEFRRAFIAFGVVYFIGSIDHFIYRHIDIDTKFDRIQPYLITIINAYMLAYLIGGGRRKNVHGLFHYCATRINGYNLHISSDNQAFQKKER